MKKVRLLLADDHKLITESLKSILVSYRLSEDTAHISLCQAKWPSDIIKQIQKIVLE